MKINKERLAEKFGWTKMLKIVISVLERIDEENDDLSQEIIDAVDNDLIYTDDQWEVISFYSTPDDPISFGEAAQMLVDDITEVI